MSNRLRGNFDRGVIGKPVFLWLHPKKVSIKKFNIFSSRLSCAGTAGPAVSSCSSLAAARESSTTTNKMQAQGGSLQKRGGPRTAGKLL